MRSTNHEASQCAVFVVLLYLFPLRPKYPTQHSVFECPQPILFPHWWLSIIIFVLILLKSRYGWYFKLATLLCPNYCGSWIFNNWEEWWQPTFRSCCMHVLGESVKVIGWVDSSRVHLLLCVSITGLPYAVQACGNPKLQLFILLLTRAVFVTVKDCYYVLTPTTSQDGHV